MPNTFTATRSFRFGGTVSKNRVRVEGILAIDTTASAGSAPGHFPASMFGLRLLTNSSSAVVSTNDKMYPTAPDYSGGSLLVGGGTSQATMNLPNGNYYVTVEGIKG